MNPKVTILSLSTQAAYFGSFVCGLSLCNQHTIVFYVASIVVYVLYRLHRRGVMSLLVLLRLGMAFTAGLLPYLYLPLASWLRWARWTWGDHTTLSGLLTHLLRKEYGTFNLVSRVLEFVHNCNSLIIETVIYKMKKKHVLKFHILFQRYYMKSENTHVT